MNRIGGPPFPFVSLVAVLNVKVLRSGSHSPSCINLAAGQHILGLQRHKNMNTLSCARRGASPPDLSMMSPFLRSFARTGIRKARRLHISRAQLSRSHVQEHLGRVGSPPQSAQRRHLHIVSIVSATNRSVPSIHTNLERSERKSVTLPFAVDQAFFGVPNNLSVLQRFSACRAFHIFCIYRPAAFHAFVDSGGDL
jgi:hypothetical protein